MSCELDDASPQHYFVMRDVGRQLLADRLFQGSLSDMSFLGGVFPTFAGEELIIPSDQFSSKPR